ncbi:SH3 domain-containing protein [Methylocystis sp. ATCC 49242]|uniref:SH3 domain-containing protein n=1 Tax=Methylocystis sp. ATCC 49242 TaxID=622637 RepID=UPI0001F86EB6|nr:SH3 domain-containing protein [Methylocystis sp. ATCC 49242]
MSQKLSPLTGLTLAAFAAVLAWGAPALAGDRCKVTDPTGTPLNIRDIHKNIVGTIENGRIVTVQRYGEDDAGKPWAYVTTQGGKRLGWVYREFISCY